MQTDGTKFTGWTLLEAFQRCVDPDAFSSLRDAEGEWRAIGAPTRFVFPGALIRGYDDPDARRARQKASFARQKYHAVQTERRNVVRSLHQLLETGRLVAWGRRESPLFDRIYIDPSAWSALSIIDLRKSVAKELTKVETRVLDIRVYPVLLAPNAADIIVGGSLVEIFRDFVLNDPEVAARAKEAVREHPQYSRVFVEGSCYPHGVDEWPVMWGDDQLRRHREPTDWADLIVPLPEAVQPADRALAERFHALVELFRREEIQASGIPSFPNYPTAVPKSLWSHRDFHFNATTGDLFELNRESVDPPRDRLTKRWSGLLLSKPTVATVARPGTEVLAGPPTGRRQHEAARTTSAARAACLAWLTEEMRKSPREKTRPKSFWRAEALKRWKGRLSGRAFESIWTDAVDDAKAFAWSYPGAPKKSPRKQSPR